MMIKREEDAKARKIEMRRRKDCAIARVAEEKSMDAARKAKTRKPKVAPVMGSKVKMDKMLKKSMASLSLGGSAATKKTAAGNKKINMADEESSGDEEMAGANTVARIDNKNKISKHRDGISRAQEVQLKKEIRRRLRMGSKEARKDAKRLRNRLLEGLEKRRDTTERKNAERRAASEFDDELSEMSDDE